MNKLKLINKILLLFAIISIIGGIIAVTILTKNYPEKTTETSDNIEISEANLNKLVKPTKNNINYTLEVENQFEDIDNVKTTQKVYKIDKENKYFPSKDFAEKIAHKMNLNLISNEHNIILYGNDGKTEYLEYYVSQYQFRIVYSNDLDKQYTHILSQEKASTYAKTQIENLGLWPFEKDSYKETYQYYDISGNNYVESDADTNAVLLKVSFSSLIDNFPIILTTSNSGEIEITFDLSQNIKSITYTYRPFLKDKYINYPIVPSDFALNRISYGEGEIYLPFEAYDPEKVTINNISVVYKIELTEQEYIQPVYVFDGLDNREQHFYILVPLVEEDYLILK